MEASCRIQDHHIITVLLGVFDGGFRNIHRILPVSHGKHRNPLLLPVDLQLLDSSRPIYVTGCKDRFSSFGLKLAGDLRRGGSLARALETCHHDDRDLVRRFQKNLRGLRTHETDQLFVDDLHYHLSRSQAVQHILSHGPLLNGADKLLHHLKADICLQKGHLHFLQGSLDVSLA